ncbi:unnamed protein product [Rhodiola kirilowii]
MIITEFCSPLLGLTGTEDDDEIYLSSDSEIGDALDYLDSRDDDGFLDGAFTLNSWRPNAHGGIHSQRNASALQPLSNRTQKFAASPLEDWEGRVNVNMSNSVNTEMCENIRGMAIGKTITHEKADRATVEQALDPRTFTLCLVARKRKGNKILVKLVRKQFHGK